MFLILVTLLGPQQMAQAINSAGAAAWLDPQVQSQISSLPPGEMLTVIVTLRQQADLSAPGLQNDPDRLQRVIGLLQAQAQASQQGINRMLERERGLGRVSQVMPKWG